MSGHTLFTDTIFGLQLKIFSSKIFSSDYLAISKQNGYNDKTMFSISCITIRVFIWIGLLNCLLIFTVGWPVSPLYGRRRLLRNVQEQRQNIRPYLKGRKPDFGHRIPRSVGSVEVNYADVEAEQTEEGEGWKRELQG